jgi:chromate transporter
MAPQSEGSNPTPWRWSALRFCGIWLLLGLQSFGGGVATLALIRRAAVDRYRWLTEAEFTRDWALVQVAPGINLLGVIVLIGRRVRGARGAALALFGLLLPSVAVTLLLTAGYDRLHRLPEMQAALRGVIPATVGLGLLTGLQMARPPLAAARSEGRGRLAVGLGVLIGSGVALEWLHWPPVLILVLSGLALALAGRRPTPSHDREAGS